jgi:ketosteroid isomerase-like protein
MGTERPLEVARRVWEAWQQGDTDSVFELYADDIEWTMYQSTDYTADEPDTFRGHEGVRRFHRGWLEVWGDYSARAELVEELGETVLLRVESSGVSKLAGLPGEMTTWHLWEVRDGKVARVRGYPTEAEARAVAQSG